MSMAEPEDFRGDKQMMLLAKSHVQLQWALQKLQWQWQQHIYICRLESKI